MAECRVVLKRLKLEPCDTEPPIKMEDDITQTLKNKTIDTRQSPEVVAKDNFKLKSEIELFFQDYGNDTTETEVKDGLGTEDCSLSFKRGNEILFESQGFMSQPFISEDDDQDHHIMTEPPYCISQSINGGILRNTDGVEPSHNYKDSNSQFFCRNSSDCEDDQKHWTVRRNVYILEMCRIEDCSKYASVGEYCGTHGDIYIDRSLKGVEDRPIQTMDNEYRQGPEETSNHKKSKGDDRPKPAENDRYCSGLTCDNYSDTINHTEEDSLKPVRKGGYRIKHGGVYIKMKCIEELCSKRANKGGYCAKHGGISTKMKCIEEDCSKRANKGGYCIKHGGVSIKRKCMEENCSKRANKGGYCAKHGGVSIIMKCIEEDCSKRANKGGFCAKHCAIPIKTKCIEEDCSKQANKGGYCIKHGGISIKMKCTEENCSKRANKAGYCVEHGGVCIKRKCIEENCSKRANKGGYCRTHGGTINYQDNTIVEDDLKSHSHSGYYTITSNISYSERKVDCCSKLATRDDGCSTHGGFSSYIELSTIDCSDKTLESGSCLVNGGISYDELCESEDCPKKAKKGVFYDSPVGVMPDCEAEGCPKPARKGGYCRAHGIDHIISICASEGCSKFAQRIGFCGKHRSAL